MSLPRLQTLITGGAGFIGRRLAASLIADGGSVRVLDNFSRSQAGDLLRYAPTARLIPGDIRDRSAVAEAVRGCDVVFHLAAVSTVAGAESDPELAFDVNVKGCFNVVRAARDHGVGRVVFASSREVYGNPEILPVAEGAPLVPHNVYGASKAAAELAALMAGGPAGVAVVRMANVYGSGDRGRVIPLFIDRALRGEPLVVYGGTQILDFVPVSRVVEAVKRVGTGSPCEGPFNIGSGKGVTILELARAVIRMAGSRSLIRVEPARPFEVDRFVADAGRIAGALGWQPPTDPLEALPAAIEDRRKDLEEQFEAVASIAAKARSMTSHGGRP